MQSAQDYRREHNRQRGECTWCGGPVKSPRRTWCSDECVEAWRCLYDWAAVRRSIYRRDKGICADCGCDCEKLSRVLWHVKQTSFTMPMLKRSLSAEVADQLGFRSVWPNDLWAVHHVEPRHRGGGNEPANLVTLCVPCHKRRHSGARR